MQTDGQALDRPQVRGDLLAHAAVAACGAAHEASALVDESDAEPIDLGLADIAERRAGEHALEARFELVELIGRRRVVERQHRHLVLDGLEELGRRPRDALRRTVRCDELRKLRLELAELAQEPVVVGVRDLRTRFDVVQIVVVVDLLAQLGETLRGVGALHIASIASAPAADAPAALCPAGVAPRP